VDPRPAPTPTVYHAGGVAANEHEASPVRVARRVSVHAVCVAACRTHRDDGTGACAACGQASPCRTRRNAVSVIEAYADDPRRYDAPAGRLRPMAGVASASLGVPRG
jgi:hypothetical protein